MTRSASDSGQRKLGPVPLPQLRVRREREVVLLVSHPFDVLARRGRPGRERVVGSDLVEEARLRLHEEAEARLAGAERKVRVAP